MSLFGRDGELKVLGELVDGPAERRGVLIYAETGIGKSALVAEAVTAAWVAGLRVLTATGVHAERNLAYAGLHQLLYPILPVWTHCPLRGVQRCGAPWVLTKAASPALTSSAWRPRACWPRRPLPALCWSSPRTCTGWTARAPMPRVRGRRIDSEPVLVIATLREGERSPVQDTALSPMPVDRLSDETAANLLDAVAPGLPPIQRRRRYCTGRFADGWTSWAGPAVLTASVARPTQTMV